MMATAAQLSGSDKVFMEKAANAGKAEIINAQLALLKTSNVDVKEFAQMMINDHSRANDELRDLAERKGVILPKEPNAKQKKKSADLQAFSDEDFDNAYINSQINAHETVIEAFRSELDEGADIDLKAFAQKFLPRLESHYKMAKRISDGL